MPISLARTSAGANLANARLDLAWIMRADFAGANLSGASLQGPVVFPGLEIVAADAPNFAHANFAGARIIARFSDGDLRGANFAGANLGADLRNQSMGLLHTEFIDADLRGASFAGANLAYADFSFAKMQGADLRGAHLHRANFSGADLTGCQPHRRGCDRGRFRRRGADRGEGAGDGHGRQAQGPVSLIGGRHAAANAAKARARWLIACLASGAISPKLVGPAVGDEHRVVAETPLPARRPDGHAVDAALEHLRVAVRPGEAEHRDEMRAPVGIAADQLVHPAHRMREILFRSGPARRMDARARRPSDRDAEAEIVGQRRQPGRPRRRQRLEPRIAGETVLGLLRLGQAERARPDTATR